MALENGYRIIRICQRIVFYDKENWQIQLINAINQNINYIEIGSIYE